MTQKKFIRNVLLAGLVLSSLTGLLVHVMVHPSAKLQVYYLPVGIGLISLVFVPLLFLFKKTVHYGYVLNGMIAIIGAVTMMHFSIHHFPKPFLFGNILYKTLIIDVLILGMKFSIGKALFDLEMFGGNLQAEHGGLWYRYPNLGWWGIHLVTISIVYTTGHIFWRGL